MASSAPSHNQSEFTVSEISYALKRTVEDSFGYVRVRGEISGFKRAASGHCYLNLKDDKSVLNAVCWRGVAGKLAFAPEDGLEVICTGKLTTYPGRSNYQLVIEAMEPAGVGALMALLEQRRKQLEAEGLFRAERKRALPFLPEVIGVITSPTGAVIRDILHRISDRFPRHVLLWPVLVQGEGAAQQVATAIEGFNALPEDGPVPRPDVLIVARGGGSLEDLWAFNEEIVVRAAANSQIPLISAVGHETDTTLIDYASDKRAPTPTAAAEIAVPVREEWLYTLGEHGLRLQRGLNRLMNEKQQRIEGLARGLGSPQRLLDTATQRFDDWSERLHTALPTLLQRKQERLAGLRLSSSALRREWRRGQDRQTELSERLVHAYTRQVIHCNSQLQSLGKLLESYHYKRVLERGFVLVRREGESAPCTSAGMVTPNAALSLEFHDGQVSVRATGGTETSPPSTTAKPAKNPAPSSGKTQGSLF